MNYQGDNKIFPEDASMKRKKGKKNQKKKVKVNPSIKWITLIRTIIYDLAALWALYQFMDRYFF